MKLAWLWLLDDASFLVHVTLVASLALMALGLACIAETLIKAGG